MSNSLNKKRLSTIYKEEVVPNLRSQFSYSNLHQVPEITKISLNRGLGEASQNKKAVESSMKELATISGQKPIITRAKKSIAGFKVRKGQEIGLTVTLRRERKFAFLERLIHLALPRTRDFRGISKNSFDGRGNLNLGVREQLIFPEIEYDEIDKIRGIDINIVTSAKTDEEGFYLLKSMGMPFREK